MKFSVDTTSRTGNAARELETIELQSLDDLLQFVRDAGEEVIIQPPNEARELWVLEIYDSYRE